MSCVLTCWTYAVLVGNVIPCASLREAGTPCEVVRVVDRNATVVRFADGLQAVVHPSGVCWVGAR